MIRKFITAAVATAVIGTATLTAPTEAQAHGSHVGVGIAAGIIGGTILGAAIANSRNTYYEDDYVRCYDRRFVDDWGHVHWRRVCHRD